LPIHEIRLRELSSPCASIRTVMIPCKPVGVSGRKARPRRRRVVVVLIRRKRNRSPAGRVVVWAKGEACGPALQPVTSVLRKRRGSAEAAEPWSGGWLLLLLRVNRRNRFENRGIGDCLVSTLAPLARVGANGVRATGIGQADQWSHPGREQPAWCRHSHRLAYPRPYHRSPCLGQQAAGMARG